MQRFLKLSKLNTIVVGGGAAGLFAALALTHFDIKVTLVAPLTGNDPRTTALMQPAIIALTKLGLFEKLRPFFAPLRTMRLIDATDSFFKAPETVFEAGELGLETFGYNIENHHLTRVLFEAFKGEVLTAPVKNYTTGSLVLEDNSELSADLIIAADGKNSFIRRSVGIISREAFLPQVALTCSFTHSRSHYDSSTEFHTREGPMTFVPMQGHKSSLVWVMRPERAEQLKKADLAFEIGKSSQHMLGKIILEGKIGFFPLSSLTPSSLIADKLALIGEAAHVLPPIGAQGLNLSFRDGAVLAELITQYPHDYLHRYQKSRESDIATRSFAVNALNYSLLSGFMPIHAARAFGMSVMDQLPALRGFVMKQGLAPSNLPALMMP